jgi:hypothetical protein
MDDGRGQLVRLKVPHHRVEPEDAPELIRRSGRTERELANLLNRAIGCTILGPTTIAAWAAGVGRPTERCLQALLELTQGGGATGLG